MFLRREIETPTYSIAAMVAVILGIYFTSHYSYLLFHTLVEIVTIAIAFALFILTWNTRRYLKDNYLWLLGTGYGFIAVIDLLHTLAYKGMNIFSGYDANLPTQLWIAARYLQAVILCVASFAAQRRLDNRIVFGVYTAAVSGLVFLAFSGNFPDCFVEGKGLTAFKINSEYAISILLLVSLYAVYGKRAQFNDRVFALIACSIGCTVLSEISFTLFVSLYGFANLVGHFAKLVAFYLIYRAILVTGLREPFEVVFRSLKQSEQELEQRVAERTHELRRSNDETRRLNRELQAISNCNQVLMRATEEPALLREICRTICEAAGYRMAWVGYPEDDTAKTVKPVAWAGVDDGYLAAAHITWADTRFGSGPTGEAIRSGQSKWIDDFATDPVAAPWSEQALQRGYGSSIALPLKGEHAKVFGVLNIYAIEPRAFTPMEVRLLEELAADMAFGITVLRGRVERTRAEAALRESEERYRSLVQKLQTAVVVHAADTRIVICNSVAQTLLGLTEEKLLGKTAIDSAWHFFREDGTRMPFEEYPVNSVLSTRRPLRNQILGVHRPGNDQDAWAMVNASPIFGRDGEISEVIVTFIDVTERREAQEKLAHLAAIVESTDDAIIGKSLDERILSWNRGAERIYGYAAAEIVGRPIALLVPPPLEDELTAIMGGVKRGELVEHLETIRRRKDGQLIQVALTISPLRDACGTIVGASTIARDITERKRAEEQIRELNASLEQRVKDRTRELAASEERMRLFFEHRLVGTAITSPEKGWVQVNDKLCQMLGYSREELLRLDWAQLTFPEDLPAELAEFDRLLRGEIESYVLEKRFVRKDGGLVFTNLAVGCVRRPDRSVDYVLALMEDITERKRAEADIQQLNQKLRERAASLEVANQGLEAFSYSVSHDLRSPLRTIDGFSRLLLTDYGDKLDAEGRDNLHTIRAATRRMGQLIEDLLSLARVSRDELHREPVDLSALAAAVAGDLRQTSPERQVEFVIAPNLTASGDARLLRIVFENLLGNAYKFSSARPLARIEFGQTTRDGEPSYFVRDNGAGFDAASARKLFAAFQRFHSASEFPGTGIGLATVQRIILRHGGRITADSQPGHGATFYFTLPGHLKESQ